MPVTVTVQVACDPARAWGLITDVENWPAWNPTCAAARIEGDGLDVGARMRLQLRHPTGRLFWTAPVVSELVANERFAFVTRSLGFRAPTEISLTSPADGLTDILLESRSIGPLASSYRLTFPEKAQGQLWSGALTGLAQHVRSTGPLDGSDPRP